MGMHISRDKFHAGATLLETNEAIERIRKAAPIADFDTFSVHDHEVEDRRRARRRVRADKQSFLHSSNY